MEELKQTAPGGRTFAETVGGILEREKNWVKWKNDLCAPFDLEPWREEVDGDGGKRKVGLEEATMSKRMERREDPPDWKWKLGSEPLTEIWEMGYRDLNDLRNPFQLSSRALPA
jgi:THO complex subunit 1